jgi:4-hydroxy-tetrahydrodipicolinate reductase
MIPIRLAVFGAAGRMGQRVIALANQDAEFQIVGALEGAGHPKLGQDCGEVAGLGALGVPLSTHLGPDVDIVIDFSTPEACVEIAKVCQTKRLPLVVATTGLSPEQRAIVETAAQETAILMAPSMSLAVNLAMKLVADAGRILRNHPSGVDVEIIERHHRFKEDAPSGTALKFGQIVAREMGQEQHVHGREGRIGKRPHGEIGYHALRVGDNVGEHTIVFGMLGETLEIAVRGQSRDSYAVGALQAARFLVKQRAGMYDMFDALGLKSEPA